MALFQGFYTRVGEFFEGMLQSSTGARQTTGFLQSIAVHVTINYRTAGRRMT